MTLPPAVLADVDVDIGHLVAARVHEPLEQQPVLDRIDVAQPQQVAHHRADARASGADGDAVVAGVVAEVPDDQEVRAELLRCDDLRARSPAARGSPARRRACRSASPGPPRRAGGDSARRPSSSSHGRSTCDWASAAPVDRASPPARGRPARSASRNPARTSHICRDAHACCRSPRRTARSASAISCGLLRYSSVGYFSRPSSLTSRPMLMQQSTSWAKWSSLFRKCTSLVADDAARRASWRAPPAPG